MRLRLFWLAIAALYAAPVVAGLIGAGWGALAGFAVIFAGFNLLMKRIPPEPLLATASIAVVAGLALVLLAFGWGLRALTGGERALPVWPWLVLGAGATVLARIAWPPRMSRDLEKTVDEAVVIVEGMAADAALELQQTPLSDLDRDAVRRMNAALDAMPKDAQSDEVARVVLPLTDQAAPAALFGAALIRCERDPAPRDLAALHWAAVNDEALRLCTGQHQLAQAWFALVAAKDHAALDRFAGAAIRLIHDDPHAWRDMPQSGEIIHVALAVEAQNPALAEELAGLGRALVALERSEDG